MLDNESKRLRTTDLSFICCRGFERLQLFTVLTFLSDSLSLSHEVALSETVSVRLIYSGELFIGPLYLALITHAVISHNTAELG